MYKILRTLIAFPIRIALAIVLLLILIGFSPIYLFVLFLIEKESRVFWEVFKHDYSMSLTDILKLLSIK